jgi:hypothetical protein
MDGLTLIFPRGIATSRTGLSSSGATDTCVAISAIVATRFYRLSVR